MFRDSRIGLGVLAGIGLVLVGFGVFGPRAPIAFAADLTPESHQFRELESVLRKIERATEAGDLHRFRAALTPRYFAELEQRITDLGGGKLDGFALHDMASFLGDLESLEFRLGLGEGARAVLVYAVGNSVSGWRLQAFTFDATNGVPRLDGKRADAVREGADVGPWARALASRCLRGER